MHSNCVDVALGTGMEFLQLVLLLLLLLLLPFSSLLVTAATLCVWVGQWAKTMIRSLETVSSRGSRSHRIIISQWNGLLITLVPYQ